MAKEAFVYGKDKEVYLHGKKGLIRWQKRPNHMAKEAYSYGKRGLFIWQKRPIRVNTPATPRRTHARRRAAPAGHILKKSVPCQIYCIKAYEEDFSEWVPAD